MLENWSLRRGSRLKEVVATGGSTVVFLLKSEEAILESILLHVIFKLSSHFPD